MLRWLLPVRILPYMQPSWKAYDLCRLQEYLKYGGELGHMWFEMCGKASVWNLFTKHCSLRLTRYSNSCLASFFISFSLVLAELQTICKQYWNKIYILEGDKWELERISKLKEFEVKKRAILCECFIHHCSNVIIFLLFICPIFSVFPKTLTVMHDNLADILQFPPIPLFCPQVLFQLTLQIWHVIFFIFFLYWIRILIFHSFSIARAVFLTSVPKGQYIKWL